nr:DMT family transporter [uncultured Dongia sp.]
MATSDRAGGGAADQVAAGPEIVGPVAAHTPTAAARRGPLPGITCLVIGAAVFSLQDVVIKLMSGGGYPLSEVLTVRGFVACVPLAFLLHFGGGGLTALFSPRWKILTFRAFLLLCSYTTYYLAIANMPLAVAVALFFAAPLFIVLLSGPMLGEKVRPAQITAVVVGFVGVLVICFGPSVIGNEGGTVDSLLTPAALLALASPLFYGIAAVMARQLADSESGAVMSSYQNLVFLAGALVTALITNMGSDLSAGIADRSLQFLLRPWIMPDTVDFLMIASTGLIGACGSFLLTQAYRLAEANIVTPFEYVSILFGTLFGWWIWNEVPTTTTIAGIVLIIGAGLYVLRGKPDAI